MFPSKLCFANVERECRWSDMVIAWPLQAQVDCWKYHIDSYFILCILNLYSYFCSEKKIFSDRKPELLKLNGH